MDLSRQAAMPLSDKYDNGQHRQTEEDTCDETSSNIDYETNDVTIQRIVTSFDVTMKLRLSK